ADQRKTHGSARYLRPLPTGHTHLVLTNHVNLATSQAPTLVNLEPVNASTSVAPSGNHHRLVARVRDDTERTVDVVEVSWGNPLHHLVRLLFRTTRLQHLSQVEHQSELAQTVTFDVHTPSGLTIDQKRRSSHQHDACDHAEQCRETRPRCAHISYPIALLQQAALDVDGVRNQRSN